MSSGRCPVPPLGEGWRFAANSFYVSAFAASALAAKCFGFAATATEDSAIAARCAASELIYNSVGSPTAATNKAPKDYSITETVSGSIADAEPMPA